MRYFLIFTIFILTLLLIFHGINPNLIIKHSPDEEIQQTIIFKKATGNISKLKTIIENCKKESEPQTAEEESENLPREQKLLNELELIVAYQNLTLAQYKYKEIQSKSVKREVPFAEVQKAYRELETAELYFNRLLENYPQGKELFR